MKNITLLKEKKANGEQLEPHEERALNHAEKFGYQQSKSRTFGER